MSATETIDKLYLELSLVTKAITRRELILTQEIEDLKARIAELEANQKPAEPKRKTLGEICEHAYNAEDVSSQTQRFNDAAEAVAKAIIERHLNAGRNDGLTVLTKYTAAWQESVIKAIRKEFEE